ncbi:hypothetical protein ACFFMM_05755 [Micromonospora chaiyaphumensis]|uniref:Uncharacterized protein n=1 Tax=Micromonospora chaiyaphumensis TaxID=307119 RepID=A0A1C4VF22_9ACTN|nr:hypothetical protein [Micromonospora chaiyaphumensis]SCE82546.1 hypothetical protein GA0070214_102303 [Micromonospora chaiyaphumensis]
MKANDSGADPVSPTGGTVSRRPLVLTVTAVVVLVAAAIVALVALRDRGAAPARPTAPRGAAGEPGERGGVATTVSPSGPVKVLAGTTPGQVTDAWVKRWPGPVDVDGSLHTVRATLPGTRDQLSASVGQPAKDRRDEVTRVFCLVKHRGTVQPPLVRTLVDGCLGPVLRAEERTAVLAWLNSADLSVPHQQVRRFPRFELLADHTADTSFSFILNAR